MGPSCNLLRVAVSKYMVTAVILEPREKRLGSKSQGGNVTARHDVATYHRERVDRRGATRSIATTL